MLIQLEQEVVADVKKRYGAEVARSTKRFLSLQRDLSKCTLDHLVAMGRELIAVKKKLKHGQWLNWVQKDLGTHRGTAENISNVAEAYDANAESLQHFNSLDVTRLYRLARVRPEKLRQLSPDTPLPITPGGAPIPLANMNTRDFDAALDLFEGRRRHRSVTPSVPGISQPPLDRSNREAFVQSLIAAIELLITEIQRIRELPGKLTAGRKEEAEAVVEKLRKAILRLPAWAIKHR